ncbi:MAG: hypothetical protein ACOYIM_00065 [Bacilli bacterium]|jgi:hypothetical protein
MSKFLNDIVLNKITVEEGLQRLLVIANRTNNKEVASWCMKELNGYEKLEELPDYRKIENLRIVYSGINGKFQVNNASITPGFLSKETLSKIKIVGIFENVAKIEENKTSKETFYIDLTWLAGEVYKNTNKGFGGVNCTSIRQEIPSNVYSSVYSNVKTRVINLLCSYESAQIDIDKLDIKEEQIRDIESKSKEIYETIIIEGKLYTFAPKEKKIIWRILVPIIIGVASGLLVYLITKLLAK